MSQRIGKENNSEYKFQIKLLLLELSSEIHGKDAFDFKRERVNTLISNCSEISPGKKKKKRKTKKRNVSSYYNTQTVEETFSELFSSKTIFNLKSSRSSH